jgi:acetyl esterase/lipase
MRAWSRIISLIVPAVAFLVLAQGSAWATDPVEDDPVVDLADIQNGGITTRLCGTYAPGYQPDVADVVYRTVQGVQLKLDVYKVPTGVGSPSNFAALVVVHGGGWVTGCKRWSAVFAKDAATGVTPSPYFLTFSIDYRLACDSAQDQLINPYCGWNFAKPGDDVEYAVSWVRSHASSYLLTGQTWNGKVALFGSSAGGNLAFEGAMHASGNKKPDAVAGWSGIPDIGYQDGNPNNPPYCDDSFYPDFCQTEAENYIGCALDVCTSKWDDASPDSWIDSADPPTFIGNSRIELSPPLAADEFKRHLDDFFVPNSICWVDEPGPPPYPHGLGLRNYDCDDNNGTAWSRTMDWFDDHT